MPSKLSSTYGTPITTASTTATGADSASDVQTTPESRECTEFINETSNKFTAIKNKFEDLDERRRDTENVFARRNNEDLHRRASRYEISARYTLKSQNISLNPNNLNYCRFSRVMGYYDSTSSGDFVWGASSGDNQEMEITVPENRMIEIRANNKNTAMSPYTFYINKALQNVGGDRSYYIQSTDSSSSAYSNGEDNYASALQLKTHFDNLEPVSNGISRYENEALHMTNELPLEYIKEFSTNLSHLPNNLQQFSTPNSTHKVDRALQLVTVDFDYFTTDDPIPLLNNNTRDFFSDNDVATLNNNNDSINKFIINGSIFSNSINNDNLNGAVPMINSIKATLIQSRYQTNMNYVLCNYEFHPTMGSNALIDDVISWQINVTGLESNIRNEIKEGLEKYARCALNDTEILQKISSDKKILNEVIDNLTKYADFLRSIRQKSNSIPSIKNNKTHSTRGLSNIWGYSFKF